MVDIAQACTAVQTLKYLNLGTNRIDDSGCATLSLLLGGGSGCGNKMSTLEHLDLSKTFIHFDSPLFEGLVRQDNTAVVRDDKVVCCSLQYLDLSYNCHVNDTDLQTLLKKMHCCHNLTTLRIHCNRMTQNKCNFVYTQLQDNGTLLLE